MLRIADVAADAGASAAVRIAKTERMMLASISDTPVSAVSWMDLDLTVHFA